MIDLFSSYKGFKNLYSHRISYLPILILMPHSSCNCKCIMCDIWKANNEKKELTAKQIENHLLSFKKLNVKWIVFSGGEALLNKELWKIAEVLKKSNINLSLLSTGLLLKKHGENIIKYFDDVIVSLDGSKEIHNKIRNVKASFAALENGINYIKSLNPTFRITGRCVIQKENFGDFVNIIKAAKDIKLDQISFLAADVSSEAFNRLDKWDNNKINEVSLNLKETHEFENIIDNVINNNQNDFENNFIAERPKKLKNIVQYYKAINGISNFPKINCNAPWFSSVIEADGEVLPCYFHKAIGNINEKPLTEILNSKKAIDFRKNLDVNKNPTCRKCVCTLKVNPLSML